MKTSNQLKALVRNLSRKVNVEAEVILRNFMLERLLERIAASKYRNRFILKGGMLIAAMVGIATRSTMDMDITIKEQSLRESEIVSIVTDILGVPVDDGVIFTFKSVEEIREEADYPGYRVSIEAILDKTRQVLKLDITTGDAVTPRAVGYDFKLMFEDRAITLLAYNLEKVALLAFVLLRGDNFVHNFVHFCGLNLDSSNEISNLMPEFETRFPLHKLYRISCCSYWHVQTTKTGSVVTRRNETVSPSSWKCGLRNTAAR